VTTRHWQLTGGGEARVVAVEGERVTLEATRASPPGSTLEGRSSSAGAFQVKVRGCKRASPTSFRIEGRLVNLSRSQREALDANENPVAN